MTKTDFILQAMLQLAANPKYVEECAVEDIPEVTYPSLMEESIFIDAEALAEEAEKRLDNPFDREDNGPRKTMQSIAESLEGIDRQVGGLNDALDRIADND